MTAGAMVEGDVDVVLMPDVVIRVRNGPELAARAERSFGTGPPSGTRSDPICTIRVVDASDSDATDSSTDASDIETDGSMIVDLETFGVGGMLVCRPGASVGELLPWINVLLVDLGVLPLHASAFDLGRCAVVLVGAAHSGKTGAMLASVDDGAAPLGDECIWVAGGAIHGPVLPVEVRARYLREMPSFRSRLARHEVRRALAFERVAGSLAAIAPTWARRCERRARVVADSRELVGDFRRGLPVAHLFISRSHEDSIVEVRDVDHDEAVAMVRDIQFREFAPIRDVYSRWRGSADSQRCDVLEHLESNLVRLMDDVLADTRVHLLVHPYPVRAARLLEAVREAST